MSAISGDSSVRGLINTDMTVELAVQLGKYIGTKYGKSVVLATNNKVTSGMLKSAAISGLMSVGTDVYDLGVQPAPVMQYYLKHRLDINGGLMITSSLDDVGFNGVKAMSSNGMDDPIFRDDPIEKIEKMEFPAVPSDKIGERFETLDVVDRYIESVLQAVDVEAIRKANFKVCVDCANGPVMNVIPTILQKLNMRFVLINSDDPRLNHDKADELAAITLCEKADFGVAFDTDGGRCIFATDRGEKVWADKAFAIIAKSILEKKKGKVIIPINSTSAMVDAIENNGGYILYCTIGEPMIAGKVMENMAVLGGDIYGSFIFPEHMTCSDAIFAMVKMAECIALNGPLKEQVDAIPTYYLQRDYVDCPKECFDKVLAAVRAEAKDLKIDTTDGVKVILDDGWIMVRPSIFEPLIRIYTESVSEALSKQWLEQIKEGILKLLQN